MTNFPNNRQGTKEDISTADMQAGVEVDSRALQEIIEILKYPFQTSCDRCNGLGIVRSGDDCPACNGSGKVLDDYFK